MHVFVFIRPFIHENNTEQKVTLERQVLLKQKEVQWIRHVLLFIIITNRIRADTGGAQKFNKHFCLFQ